MNKQGLVEAIHAKTGGTKTQADEIMETIISTITETLKKGEDVSIAGLGIFSTRERQARQARNPRTGETINVPAMRVAKFKPAKGLKEAVRNS